MYISLTFCPQHKNANALSFSSASICRLYLDLDSTEENLREFYTVVGAALGTAVGSLDLTNTRPVYVDDANLMAVFFSVNLDWASCSFH